MHAQTPSAAFDTYNEAIRYVIKTLSESLTCLRTIWLRPALNPERNNFLAPELPGSKQMKLFSSKTIAALFITVAMSVGNASAGDTEQNTSQSGKLSDTSISDTFINVKAAVASRFNRTISSTGGLSARQVAQKDLLNRSAHFAGNNL